MAARRQRQEEEDRLRKEASDSRLATEYAQNMLNWSRMVHAHNENMQRFMESVAFHTGMPAVSVPPPMPPPPQPPTYVGVSPTPNPSPDNVGTFSSCFGAETPDETISRIAGVYRGHLDGNSSGGVDGNPSAGVNGTRSGGGTYSPPLHPDGNSSGGVDGNLSAGVSGTRSGGTHSPPLHPEAGFPFF